MRRNADHPETIEVPTWYYQQFDADWTRDCPGETFGGWRRTELELAPARTALVVMHAWDAGTAAQYPGWWRCEEYLTRADQICATVFPRLLTAVRGSPVRVVHVGGLPYAARYPGHRLAVESSGPEPPAPERVSPDPLVDRLRAFKADHGFVGAHNRADVDRGWQHVDFPPAARPRDDEWVVTTSQQLFAFCQRHGISHLVYAGFAINWCLLMLPGGMIEMSRRGLLCSALRQAVTAVENRESARGELNKEEGLWRVAVEFGFVYDVDDFVDAIAHA